MNLGEMKLGIPDNYEISCINKRENIAASQEFYETSVFLRDFLDNSDFMRFHKGETELKFINYGDTELVYVLRIDKKMYTMVVSQPTTSFGKVKQEYDYLREFGKKSPKSIITPIHYYANSALEKELFIAPYLYQARCISNLEGKWGMYIPEPDYHFREFDEEERKTILPSIIAKLILLYDDKNTRGIASCQTIDGDFILEKELEEEKFTVQNVMNRLKLISIRDITNLSLRDYIERLNYEFHLPVQKRNIINVKSEGLISEYELEKGIKLGIKMRGERESEARGE